MVLNILNSGSRGNSLEIYEPYPDITHNEAAVKALVNRLKMGGTKNVIVVGDIMLDEYYVGSVSRISPEAPVPVLKEDHREWCLGGAANVASNCKHIGCNVSLIGIIGHNDSEGARLLGLLNEYKIDTRGVIQSAERVTTCKKRMLAQNQQLLRIDHESQGALSDKEFNDITAAFDAAIKQQSVILISNYAKGVVSRRLIEFICQRAQTFNSIILVDPKGPNFAQYEGVDYLKPNAKEYHQLLSFFGLSSTASLEDNGRLLCKKLLLKGLIITLGERGIAYVDHQCFFIVPACKHEVYDLTGAGDTVFAFLGLCLAHNLSMEECLKVANHAAAVAISHVKTYAVSLEELIDHTYEPLEKIYTDWTQLKIELDWQRSDKHKVVFTNGCFDILHPGHIHVLNEAKKLGDLLVVGINTDASVKRYKGLHRPINNFAHRVTMMAALGVVDFVVSFDQDTPYELIAYLKPDVLVKGGDYQREKIAGYDIVTSYGGRVETIDLVPGLSTTAIIETIRKEKQA